MARLASRVKMLYYPTPLTVVERIKTFIEFPEQEFTIFDSCAGEGLALGKLCEGTKAVTYGVELDEHRAQEAKKRLTHVLHCGIEEAKVSNNIFSCLFLNPPYDFETQTEDEVNSSERKEKIFLKDTTKYLQPEGLLIYIIPQHQLTKSVAKIFSCRFENFQIYRFHDSEYEQFKQIVLFAVKKKGNSINEKAYEKLSQIPHIELQELPLKETPLYKLPQGKSIPLFKSTKIDPEILEKEVKNSPLWKKFKEMTRIEESKMERPPLPLHTGHISLLLANGMLDGVIGEGEERHIVRGKVEKVVTKYEEAQDKYIEERELESFRVSIKILKQDGEIVTLM